MKSTTRLMIVALAAVTFAASVCQGGSIWARGNSRTRKLFSDDTARDIGDVLTIKIQEESKIETETTREMDKKTSRTGKMGGTLDLANVLWPVGKNIFDFPKLDFTSSSDTKFDGGADYDTDRSIADEITVVVEDVLPNGSLAVLGSRTRNIAGNKQIIEVSGIVRPSDVDFDNTVSSSRVANFHIVHRTTGQENRFTKPGWLGLIFNVLNPF